MIYHKIKKCVTSFLFYCVHEHRVKDNNGLDSIEIFTRLTKVETVTLEVSVLLSLSTFIGFFFGIFHWIFRVVTQLDDLYQLIMKLFTLENNLNLSKHYFRYVQYSKNVSSETRNITLK